MYTNQIERRSVFPPIIGLMVGLPLSHSEETREELLKSLTPIEKIATDYLHNICFYLQGKACDERLMRSIEENMDIPVAAAHDFRRQIMSCIGIAFVERREVTLELLNKFLETKAFQKELDKIQNGK